MPWREKRPPLPDWIQEAYEIVVAHVEDPGTGIDRERALVILQSHAPFEEHPGDAEYAIERLRDRGWLYEVDDTLCVTDPEADFD